MDLSQPISKPASSVFFEVIYTAYMETRAPEPENLGRNLALSVFRKVNEVTLWQIGPLCNLCPIY